jgi:hypothetical protein
MAASFNSGVTGREEGISRSWNLLDIGAHEHLNCCQSGQLLFKATSSRDNLSRIQQMG